MNRKKLQRFGFYAGVAVLFGGFAIVDFLYYTVQSVRREENAQEEG